MIFGPRRGAVRTNRRDLLRWGGAALVAGAVAGCDALSTAPADSGGDNTTADQGAKEAPELARRVAAGELPPLNRRVPTKPLVIEPTERVGRYGGTWNNPILGPADSSVLSRSIEYDGLVRWDVGWTEVIPNAAEAFEIEEDGAAYRFTLREGMRWSDGEPFTADDVLFALTDVMFNEELYPAGPPARYTNDDGTPATVEKLDDRTVRIVFAEPHGLFLDELATAGGADLTIFPRHYLSKFHRAYNPDADDEAAAAGFDSWSDHLLAKASFRETPGVPTLCAWTISTPLGEGSRVVAERNPYYWKVDPDGRQLPYLDSVTFEVIDDVETILLKATNGEFHFHTRHFNDLKNKPVVASGRTDGNYDFVSLQPSTNNEVVIMLNLTHKDPVLREIFRNKDFRIGLSHAIDRDEIINVVFQRQGTAAQPAPRPDSVFYDEEFSTQYLTYDVELANEHLDRAGLVDRDGEGFRLRPDGRRISFGVEVANPALKDTWVPAMELVREHWREVGIDIRVVSEDRSLWEERVAGNEHDATVWMGEGGLKDELLYGFYYFPYHVGSRYSILWADWYTSGGELGEEPPPESKRQLELYDRIKQEIDRDVQNELFAEIVRIGKEQFYCIGLVRSDEEYGIVRNDFHNVPKTMPFATIWPTPAPTRPEQFFIDAD